MAFHGIEVLEVETQVTIASGLPAFTVVGLPDKAVAELRERVRSALQSLGLALPLKRITVNLAPADVLKEGSHFDLPIALALLVAMEALPADELVTYTALGELSLDGSVTGVAGVLLAGLAAASREGGIICPADCGGEAAWAGEIEIVAAPSLLAIVNHFKGTQLLPPPEPRLAPSRTRRARPQGREGPGKRQAGDRDRRRRRAQSVDGRPARVGQIDAGGAPSRPLAAAPTGRGARARHDPVGRRRTAQRRLVARAAVPRAAPFRLFAGLVGGGMRAHPGEISLAHQGVLFLDELPEFNRAALEALRQPLETGRVSIARANGHVTYPARFQLIAAMNPCRCGHFVEQACGRAPRCAEDYQGRLSGPLLDRIDLHIDVPAVSPADLALPPPSEDSAAVARRVAAARKRQAARYAPLPAERRVGTNAEADGALLDEIAAPDPDGRALLVRAADRLRLSARGYHRVLRVARTLADLEGAATVGRRHIAEALSYRRQRTLPESTSRP